MSQDAEITALVRRVTADETGHAKLFFTLTNTSARSLRLGLSLMLGKGIQSADVTYENSQSVTLAANETAQVASLLALAPGTLAGRYTLRLAAATAGQSPARSPTVEVTLEHDLPERTVPKPRPISAKARVWAALGCPWRWLRGLFKWFALRGFGLLLGTKRIDGEVSVDTAMVRRAMFAILILAVILLARSLVYPAMADQRDCTSKACLKNSLFYNLLADRSAGEIDQPEMPTSVCNISRIF